MVHEVKNIKTKLPRLGINIDFWVRWAGLAGIIGLLYVCGATISTVLVYLGCKILRHLIRLFGAFLSLVFTAVSMIILVIIISLIIF